MSYYGTNIKNSCYDSLFLAFDWFFTNPKWYINNQNRLTSMTGVFLTFIVLCLTFLTTFHSILDFFQGKSGNYVYNQKLQNTPLMVPFIQDFDIVVLIDKSNIIDWDSLFGKLDFGFYFGDQLDLKFGLCEKNQYNEYSTTNNSLLCISKNSKNQSVNLKLKPKNLVTGNDFNFATIKKKDISKIITRNNIMKKRLLNSEDNLRIRDNVEINQLTGENASNINDTNSIESSELELNRRPHICYDQNGKPIPQNERFPECIDLNTKPEKIEDNQEEDIGGEDTVVPGWNDGGNQAISDGNDVITRGDENKTNDNITNLENSTNSIDENKTQENNNDDNSADVELQEIIQEIDLKNTFTSPSFYIKPKCFADKKKCNRNNISKYINFVSYVNDMSLLLVSKKNNENSENLIGKIEMNEGSPLEIFLKKKTIVNDFSIFPFFLKNQ